MSEQCPRFQIAFLGAGGVGKTSILHRYLYGTYSTAIAQTVEDTYSQPYMINGKRQDIDYIDTAGSIAFPAMHQIYMSQANGFVLVYSLNNKDSFEEMKIIWNKIKAVRTNVLNIPIVIVGNNLDKENARQIETFEAVNWAYGEDLGGCFLEVSAFENKHIKDVFDMLLEQLGNKRTQQKGPFRIRSTSLSRKISEAKETKRWCFKSQSVNTEKILCSDKHFQESVFVDYKQSSIRRIHGKNSLAKSASMDHCLDIKCLAKSASIDHCLDINNTVIRDETDFASNKRHNFKTNHRRKTQEYDVLNASKVHSACFENKSQNSFVIKDTSIDVSKVRVSNWSLACRLVRKYCSNRFRPCGSERK